MITDAAAVVRPPMPQSRHPLNCAASDAAFAASSELRSAPRRCVRPNYAWMPEHLSMMVRLAFLGWSAPEQGPTADISS